jgi:hypothetical protein
METTLPDPSLIEQQIASCERELRALRRLCRVAKAARVAREERERRQALAAGYPTAAPRGEGARG